MAANLDTRKDGRAAAVIVGKRAWWQQEGEQLATAPTVEDAIELAGHDFEVEVQPIYLRREIHTGADDPVKLLDAKLREHWARYQKVPSARKIVEFLRGLDQGDEVYQQIPGFNATVRTDRHRALGIVGDRYTPFQNADAWKIVEPLIDAGLASIETGGTLREGRDIWIMLKLNIDNPIVQEVYAKEGLVPFVLLVNNHAGTRVVVGKEVVERVVCANTLEVALGEKHGLRQFKVRHSGEVEAKVVEAAQEMFEGMVERHAAAARQYQLLRAYTLDKALFRKLVLDVAAPLPQRKPGQKETARQESARARVERKRGRIIQLWDKGDGHTGDHSAFEAYQALTQSIDHDAWAWPTRGEGGVAEAQILGRLADTKSRVLRALVTSAKGA